MSETVIYFDGGGGGNRSIIPDIVRKCNGQKYVGSISLANRYGVVNTKYFEILNRKITNAQKCNNTSSPLQNAHSFF